MEKGQSKWKSFLEANANTLIGFIITLVASPFVYTLVGMKWTYNQLWQVTAIYTLLSILRGYVIRRFFNKGEKKKEQKLLDEITSLRQKLDDLVANSPSKRQYNNLWKKYFTLFYKVNNYLTFLKLGKDDVEVRNIYIKEDNEYIHSYLDSIQGLINQIKLRDEAISKLTEEANELSDKAGDMEDELDLCKHEFQATLADFAERGLIK